MEPSLRTAQAISPPIARSRTSVSETGSSLQTLHQPRWLTISRPLVSSELAAAPARHLTAGRADTTRLRPGGDLRDAAQEVVAAHECFWR